jgi:hypothetical protein
VAITRFLAKLTLIATTTFQTVRNKAKLVGELMEVDCDAEEEISDS